MKKKLYQRKEDEAVIDKIDENITITDYPLLGRFVGIKQSESVTKLVSIDDDKDTFVID